MLTTAALIRSATSAKFTTAGARASPAGFARSAGRGRDPGRRRHDRRRRQPAGDDEADEKRHGGRQRDGDEGEAFGHVGRRLRRLRDLRLDFVHYKRLEFIFRQGCDAQAPGFLELAAGLVADDEVAGLLADRPRHLAAQPLDGRRRPPRGSSLAACRSATKVLPASGPAATWSGSGWRVAMFTPAAASLATSARLCGSSANARTDAATTGPISGTVCSVSSGASRIASMCRRYRASVAAAFSPTCRMPSA